MAPTRRLPDAEGEAADQAALGFTDAMRLVAASPVRSVIRSSGYRSVVALPHTPFTPLRVLPTSFRREATWTPS